MAMTTRLNTIINTNTTNTSTEPQLPNTLKWRWQQQLGLETRHVSSWYVYFILFLFYFITTMFF